VPADDRYPVNLIKLKENLGLWALRHIKLKLLKA